MEPVKFVELIQTHCEPNLQEVVVAFWEAVKEVLNIKKYKGLYSLFVSENDPYVSILHKDIMIAYRPEWSNFSTHIQVTISNPMFTEIVKSILTDPIVNERMSSVLKPGEKLVILYYVELPKS